MFSKTDPLKNCGKFPANFLCQMPATLLKKRDCHAGVFLWILRNIYEQPFVVKHLQWLHLGYLFQVFIPTVSYDYWLSKYFFYFELICNTCQCFLTLCNIYTKTHISIYRTHIYIYRTHMSIYRISCCNFVAYCNFVTRKNLWICIKWNYLILSTPDCDMK